ncbi:MAG: Transglutaminase domain protein [Frankiales bacterium]|nr:Transglutaminase domain protein [Frankiales bacterium]
MRTPTVTTAGCLLQLTVDEPTTATLAVAVAAAPASETLSITVDGVTVEPREVAAHHGTRLHVVQLPAGSAVVRYDVEVVPVPAPRRVSELEAMVALRPSRYCPSDQLAPWAHKEFGSSATPEGVTDWVFERLTYGSSRPVDSAMDTLITNEGVCRDYAHLVICVLRALDIPARLASAYAPGLYPMDFHAVAEVAVDGLWQVFDATKMAPAPTLLRIATGQDAADTAFLTLTGGNATLTWTEVWAYTDGDLPANAPTHLA